MGTPLRWNMILPNGEPLRWDTPGARWGGTVEEVMAAIEQKKKSMNQNLVSAELAAQAVTDINTALATIRTKLPFLINLTPEQRRNLKHAASSGQGVIQDSLTFVAQNPSAMPGDFDAAEFAKDGALLSAFGPVAASVAQLAEDVDDTFIALQADLYSEFLDVYAFAKANNRKGTYDTFVNSVKGRFAKTNAKTAQPAAASSK